jgi:hypothetical protein
MTIHPHKIYPHIIFVSDEKSARFVCDNCNSSEFASVNFNKDEADLFESKHKNCKDEN